MLRFLADEDFNNRIVRGLRRLDSLIDIVRVQEVGLAGKPDSEVLEWAAAENRLVLTHDAATMTYFAYKRTAEQKGMPGVIAVSQYAAIGNVIDDLALLHDVSTENEWEAQVVYLPLR